MERFEKEITDTLCEKAQNIMESEQLKTGIDREVGREISMKKKHYSVKKIVILAAAACMLLGGGVFASGKLAGLVTGFDMKTINSKTTNFSELTKEEDILGYQVQAVPQFSNGYRFKQMDVNKTYGLDEDGNLLKQYAYYALGIIYENGDKKVNVTVCKPVDQETTPNISATKMAGDVQLTYSEDTYKWVPEGYELTAEDEANMKQEGYYISVGADEISEQKVAHVNWTRDGINYSIMEYDVTIGRDGMFKMAEEILGSMK